MKNNLRGDLTDVSARTKILNTNYNMQISASPTCCILIAINVEYSVSGAFRTILYRVPVRRPLLHVLEQTVEAALGTDGFRYLWDQHHHCLVSFLRRTSSDSKHYIALHLQSVWWAHQLAKLAQSTNTSPAATLGIMRKGPFTIVLVVLVSADCAALERTFATWSPI